MPSTPLLFKPGENIQLECEILSWETTRLSALRFPTSAAVKIPARIGFCVRDMETFGLPSCGQGKTGGKYYIHII